MAIRNLEAAVLEHFDALYAYAVSLTRNRSDADDLVQDTCIRALSQASDPAHQGNLKAWLFTVERNLWLNRLRRHRQGPDFCEWNEDFDETLTGGINEDPRVLMEGEARIMAVRIALMRLPVEFREIVVLRDIEDFSYREIADIIGCPTGTVMSRLARGRDKLRAMLGNAITDE